MQERCSSERRVELWAIKGFSWHSRVSHISLKWYENCKSPAVITFLSGGRGRCRRREEAREELWEDLNGRRENETGSVRIEWTCITKETEPVLIVEWISIQITWLVNISQKKSVHMFHNYRTESWIIESQLNSTWHTVFFKSWIERSCLKIKINISTTSVTQSYWVSLHCGGILARVFSVPRGSCSTLVSPDTMNFSFRLWQGRCSAIPWNCWCTLNCKTWFWPGFNCSTDGLTLDS